MIFSDKIKSGLKWTAGTKLTAQIITWGLTIYVMRLLEPKDYGLMAIAMIFISFLILIKEFGLGPAIIQSKNTSVESLKQIFGLLIILNIVLFLTLFFLAPTIAGFFDEPELTGVIRLLAVQFFFIPFESIPYALLNKSMQFKKLGIVELVTAIAGGVTTFLFAYNGHGFWSLVYGSIMLAFVRMLMLNIFSFWLKWPTFGISKIKQYMTFGGLVTLDQMLWFFYSQSDAFIVGKLLGTKVLGFYSVAMHLSSLPMQKVNSIINQVAFPAFSSIQNDKKMIEYYFEKSMKLIAFFSFPVFFGMACVAEDAVLFLLGEKWFPAIFPLTILAFIMPLRMMSNVIPTVVRGCGRADISVVNLLIASVIMPISFVVGSNWGIEGVCYAWLISYPVVFIIEISRSKVVTNVSIINIGKIILPYLISSLIMYSIVVLCKFYLGGLSHGAMLSLEALIGATVYVVLSVVFNKRATMETIKTLKSS